MKAVKEFLAFLGQDVLPSLVAIGLIFAPAMVLSSCRTTRPPALEVCVHEGAAEPEQGIAGGGADCSEADGKPLHREAKELQNYTMHSPDDYAKLLNWCFDVTPGFIQPQMVYEARGLTPRALPSPSPSLTPVKETP